MAPKKKGKDSGYAKETLAPKAPGFQMPEPDRQLHVSSPPLLPPELEGEEEAPEHLEMLQPRKIQLQHITLLKHPVTCTYTAAPETRRIGRSFPHHQSSLRSQDAAS